MLCEQSIARVRTTKDEECGCNPLLKELNMDDTRVAGTCPPNKLAAGLETLVSPSISISKLFLPGMAVRRTFIGQRD